jgi:hypothetical protein
MYPSDNKMETWAILSLAQISALLSAGENDGASLFARRYHLNSVNRDDADVSRPRRVCLDKRTHERCEIFGSCRMNSEQNDSRLFQRVAALNGDLPEVLVEGQHDTRLGLGPI